MHQLQFQRVRSELTHCHQSVEFASDVLDGLEVVVFLQRNSEGNVVLHLSEVLDRPWIRVMIYQLPFLSCGLEGSEGGRFEVDVTGLYDRFVDAVLA